MDIGWKANTAEMTVPEERNWMSVTEQQPLISSWQDDEA
jgi:hypothetical protein